jgi:hypothetical protein
MPRPSLDPDYFWPWCPDNESQRMTQERVLDYLVQPKLQVKDKKMMNAATQTDNARMPKALRGMCDQDPQGRKICYGFNLGTCPSAVDCDKGMHKCCKPLCFGNHPLSQCRDCSSFRVPSSSSIQGVPLCPRAAQGPGMSRPVPSRAPDLSPSPDPAVGSSVKEQRTTRPKVKAVPPKVPPLVKVLKNVPKALRGLCRKDPQGRRICFGFNLGTCPSTDDCDRGLHKCCRPMCFGIHPQSQCRN